MKISVDIDCTPEEARRFLGLPDVSDVNAALTDRLRERIEAGIADVDTETLLRTWLPGGTEAWRQMQGAFWERMAEAMSGTAGAGKPKPGGGKEGGE